MDIHHELKIPYVLISPIISLHGPYPVSAKKDDSVPRIGQDRLICLPWIQLQYRRSAISLNRSSFGIQNTIQDLGCELVISDGLARKIVVELDGFDPDPPRLDILDKDDDRNVRTVLLQTEGGIDDNVYTESVGLPGHAFAFSQPKLYLISLQLQTSLLNDWVPRVELHDVQRILTRQQAGNLKEACRPVLFILNGSIKLFNGETKGFGDPFLLKFQNHRDPETLQVLLASVKPDFQSYTHRELSSPRSTVHL
jgi:hypothetical protein